MALETYRQKRDFRKTREPAGQVASAGGHAYVIQKHDARRLHYDLRLELDGVLKSWAVTRGPSLVPGEKRLAVHVEDHPLEYGGFEGTIPKGEYGGGTVIVWDRGEWEPVGDPHKSLAKGHLDFILHGEKLRGKWHLVRMRAKEREKAENWLLIKSEDDHARAESDPDILSERPDSVKTGRAIQDVETESPGWSSKTGKIAAPETARPKRNGKAAPASPMPGFIEPALATRVGKPPRGAQWLHEIKFDGYRLQVHIADGTVKLWTRGGLDWTGKFGQPILDAFSALPVSNAIIDGEVVVENESGASDFSALQAELSAGQMDRFIFYAFDLLYLDGADMRAQPVSGRKDQLQRLLSGRPDRLRFSEHFQADAELVLRHACRLSLEGIVSKRRDAPYRSGRGKDWLKSKCAERQEFVIAGYVPSTVSRKAIGSLVLGYFDARRELIHIGRVGTGYTAAVAEDLFRQLQPLRIAKTPFAKKLTSEQAAQVQYVRPALVAEVEFGGWTADQSLRHAAFRGLREDKAAADVTREVDASEKPPLPRVSVKLTHPDRLYWPQAGVTKAGLADYYAEVWPRIAPFIVGRPLSLVRCPSGAGGQCFFQKHAWKGLNSNIRTVPDPLDPDGDALLLIQDLDGLIALAQAGVLEIHPWGAALANLEQPDMIIMDLDPGPDVAWQAVIDAAIDVRDRLAALGLAAFVKTSGGKGLHVVSPLQPVAGWDRVKSFTRKIAQQMAGDSPDLYVATVTKSKRAGKILIDYLRNGRGSTAVAPYSTRARETAAVSMPLAWDELGPEIGPAYFTVLNAIGRLGRPQTDPWRDFRKSARPLPSLQG